MAKSDSGDLSRIIARRRNQILSRRGWGRLVMRLLVLALLAWLLFSRVFLVCQLEGNGMYPSMKDGDLLIGFRLQREYKNDDVVFFEYQGKTCLGRIVARSNDTVTLDDSGTLFVNGGSQAGEILYPSFAKEGIEYPLRVPDGSVFVLGDYRTQTIDSRDFGPLPLEDIQGKLISLLRRRGL